MVQSVTKQLPKVKHNYVEKLVHMESQFAHDAAQHSSIYHSSAISAATFQAQCSSSSPSLPCSLQNVRDVQVQPSLMYVNRQVTNINFPHNQPLHTSNVTNQMYIPATPPMSFNSPIHQHDSTAYYNPTSLPVLPAQAPATTFVATTSSLPTTNQFHHHQYARDPPHMVTQQTVHTQHTLLHAISANNRTSNIPIAQTPPPNESDNVHTLSELFESGI